MLIIAHRANLYGPATVEENSPRAIELAAKRGFHVEIDVLTHQGKVCLGHDEKSMRGTVPRWLIEGDQYPRKMIWHCKDLGAVLWAKENKLHYFCHDKDFMALTSHGYVWTCERAIANSNTILMSGDIKIAKEEYIRGWHGICTDYPYQLKDQTMPAGFTE